MKHLLPILRAWNEAQRSTQLTSFNECLNAEPVQRAWVLLCRWGSYANSVGEQLVTADTTRDLLRAVNEERRRGGVAWPGYPIYEGHPDAPNAVQRGWINKGRIGAIMGMEARPDGLWVEREWNEDGLKNARNRKFPYPSVAWDLNPLPDGRLAPIELISVGMVEDPNMGKATAWNDSSNGTEETHNNTTTNMDLKILAAKLGLPETATADECMAKITALLEAETTATNAKAEADTTKTACNEAQRKLTLETGKVTALNESKTALEKERDTLKTDLDTARKEAVRGKVLLAVNEGRVALSEVEGQVTAFNGDVAKATEDLGKLPVKYDRNAVKIDAAGAGKVVMAVNDAQARFATVVSDYAEKHKIKDHNRAFNECWKDEANKELVAAITAAPQA